MGHGKDDNDARKLGSGPSIAAVAFWGSSEGQKRQLLTDEERARLSIIASVVRFKKGAQIYRKGARAAAVFNIVSGAVKVYRTSPDETECILAFLFADDVFGLTEEGRYVNSARAVTDVTTYRFPIPALERQLRKDAAFEFHVICKLCHELREAQRHAFLLSQRSAVVKMAMFVQMIEQHQVAKGGSATDLDLPMTRSDIADYAALSLEAVSRSFRTLEKRDVLSFRNKRVRIKDRTQLETLLAKDEL
jgi:CRP-like cAMP-binding protein